MKMMIPRGAAGFVFAGMMIVVTGCSGPVGTYDDLDKNGTVERQVRREYAPFFAAIRALGESGGGSDSLLVKKAATATDMVIPDVKEYPQTLKSRLALDALSYAAHDLGLSPGYSRKAVSDFRDMALLNPIIVCGSAYIRSGQVNVSTHVQIVRALQRGLGQKADVTHLEDILPVVGTSPPREVMSIAEKDSFLFRRIFDLVFYSRSLQDAPPPLWTVTGPWLCAVNVAGFYPMFFALVPVIVEKELYLSIRLYELGDIYAIAFHDPTPADNAAYDAWLARGTAALDKLVIDRRFAETMKDSGLPTWDAHYYSKDYIVSTDADSVKKEFTVSLKRGYEFGDAFHYTGEDSIAVVFTSAQFAKPDSVLTVLGAFRREGATIFGNTRIPGKSGKGAAYLMPIGKHDPAIIDRILKQSLPNISLGMQ
jgi:hypothetical protein